MILIYGIFIFAPISMISSIPVIEKIGKTPFTIEEATLGLFPVNSFPGKWISDHEFQYQDRNTKNIMVEDLYQNKTRAVLDESVLSKYNTTKYKFSPNRKYVLISYNEISVYRHSRTSQYVVYSVIDGLYFDVDHKQRLQHADWAPVNNTLLYVKSNDIYIVKNIRRQMNPIQVTSSGVPGEVYNGVADWTYEEEVLSTDKAYWFSPRADSLVYLTLNDKKVEDAVYLTYGEPGSIQDQYQKEVKIRYPKAGTTPPEFTLWHVTLNDTLRPRKIDASKSDILYNVRWANNSVFYYLTTNRVQNSSKTFKCDLKQVNCEVAFHSSNKNGWVSVKMPLVSSNMNRFLKIEGHPTANSGNFSHLVLQHNNGTQVQLTQGYFDVMGILHWDEKNKIVYYLAPREHNATTAHVYAVSEVDGRKAECITCNIKSPEGNLCKSATAQFSEMASYAVINCDGPDPRMVYFYKMNRPLFTQLKILEDNAKVRKNLEKKALPEVLNLEVEIQRPFSADVRLLLPPNIDKSGKTKYPLVIYVYGGPDSKMIKDSFKIDFGYYMTTNLSVIYGYIDGRNTQSKGENMLFAGYKALGTYEIEDQINVTRYLQSKLPFIDANRTGIWGWSYGGYATAKVLEKDTRNTFQCGISVAPVTDWLYYDSIYTERYMGFPDENMKGYKEASVLEDISNLRNKKYLIIHGNADDNVHYQNAMMLVRVLEKQNIPFELMSYPDENHGLRFVGKHLYYTMDRFWKRCFKLTSN